MAIPKSGILVTIDGKSYWAGRMITRGGTSGGGISIELEGMTPVVPEPPKDEDADNDARRMGRAHARFELGMMRFAEEYQEGRKEAMAAAKARAATDCTEA